MACGFQHAAWVTAENYIQAVVRVPNREESVDVVTLDADALETLKQAVSSGDISICWIKRKDVGNAPPDFLVTHCNGAKDMSKSGRSVREPAAKPAAEHETHS